MVLFFAVSINYLLVTKVLICTAFELLTAAAVNELNLNTKRSYCYQPSGFEYFVVKR